MGDHAWHLSELVSIVMMRVGLIVAPLPPTIGASRLNGWHHRTLGSCYRALPHAAGAIVSLGVRLTVEAITTGEMDEAVIKGRCIEFRCVSSADRQCRK